jgi:PAS domain S-box-containing protein
MFNSRKIKLVPKDSVFQNEIYQLESLLENLKLYIISFLPDGTITYITKNLTSLLEPIEGSYKGKNLFNINMINRKIRIRRVLSSLSVQKFISINLLPFVEKSGQKIILQWTTRAIFNDIGQIINYQSHGIEISKDQRIKLKSIRDRENDLKTIAELKQTCFQISRQQSAYHQHAIVSTTDVMGKMIAVNQNFIELSKYSKDELIGQNFSILNSDHHPKNFFQKLYSVILRGNIWHGEIKNRAKDGSCYWVDTTIIPLRDLENKIDSFLSICTAITERKESEERVIRLLEEKNIVLFEVHHRVKNNMNTIFSILKLHANTQDDIKQRQILEDAAGRVQSMMVLYDNLFRSENRDQISLKDYLPTLIQEILLTFPKQVSLNIFVTEDIIIRTEKVAPLSILINELISNTMKYSFTGRKDGLITIFSSKKENAISLVYEDDGIGLPENLSLENPKGFGLKLVGLLVRQLRGKIYIDRTAKTRFVIEFKE